jgi:ribonuclease P protein component
MTSPGRAQGRPERLGRPGDVQRALRRGRSSGGDLLAVHVLVRPSEGVEEPIGTRLTVVASRRVGGAVRRNRAKRLLREAARARRWREGLDVVLVARAACPDSDLHGVAAELERLAVKLDALEVGA